MIPVWNVSAHPTVMEKAVFAFDYLCVLKEPLKFKDETLQIASAMALVRLMMLTPKLCSENLQLFRRPYHSRRNARGQPRPGINWDRSQPPEGPHYLREHKFQKPGLHEPAGPIPYLAVQSSTTINKYSMYSPLSHKPITELSEEDLTTKFNNTNLDSSDKIKQDLEKVYNRTNLQNVNDYFNLVNMNIIIKLIRTKVE